MAHEHSHAHDTDTYYLDQVCMVGITGGFAAICLTLYFLNTDMLYLLLQDQFHPLILAAGIALAIVTLVRAFVLWKMAGARAAGHHYEHDHDHHHEHAPDVACDHDHDGHHHEHHHDEHCNHEHGHHHHEHVKVGVPPAVAHEHVTLTAAPSPALAPSAVVAHSHEHGHGADDGHDHGWAPWRYVVLLIPMMLYLLGLPGKAVPLVAAGPLDVTRDLTQMTYFITMHGSPFPQAAYAGAMSLYVDDRVSPIYVDSEQASTSRLEPGMKAWLRLVADPKVEGNKGVAGVWATRGADTPPAAKDKDLAWIRKGVIKKVNSKENTITVAETVDSQADETFDLEATVFIEFKQLEQLAFDRSSRDKYDHKKVQVVGQFVPYRGNDKAFSLSRLRIQCCGADAIQLNVPIYSRESLKGFKNEDWVRVTGRIEFRPQPNRPNVYRTVLVVNRAANVVPTAADTRPYIN